MSSLQYKAAIGMFGTNNTGKCLTSPLRLVFISLLCILFHASLSASPTAYLNEIRTMAGMTSLKDNALLKKAAQNHANYLSRHHRRNSNVSAHDESRYKKGFTGAKPSDRAIHVNYPHQQVLENVSIGESNWKKSIDSLMGAIYHRLVFLNFHVDEIGSAVKGKTHVYKLGKSFLSKTCRNPPPTAISRPAIKCGDQLVSQNYYDGLCKRLPAEALFQKPWPETCHNGQMLDPDFMKNFCRNPPSGARFKPPGSYYLLCNKSKKISSTWFDAFCNNPPAQASYKGSTRYIKHCGKKIRPDWLKNACNYAPSSALIVGSLRYSLPCNGKQKISTDYLLQNEKKRALRNPKIVLWPAVNSKKIPPAFYEESPDPLPDLSVSGYPISIQINPAYGEHISLVSFRLFKVIEEDDEAINQIRILDKSNDPNKILDERTFVLFPLKRLDWNQGYKIKATLKIDGRTINKSWRFRTASPQGDLMNLDQAGQTKLSNNRSYALYRADKPFGQIRAQYPKHTKLSMKSIDNHTLNIRINSKGCGKVKLRFEDGKRLQLETEKCR